MPEFEKVEPHGPTAVVTPMDETVEVSPNQDPTPDLEEEDQ